MRGKTEGALDVFNVIQAAGVEPNAISYSSMIIAYANGGKTEEVLDVFKSMQAAGAEPDVISYSSLITACANGGKSEAAKQYLVVEADIRSGRNYPCHLFLWTS